jgi:signal transduction protein with GAF and PtsI domain
VNEIGRGAKVFDHQPVRGRLCHLDGPDDVLALMDSGAFGVVALVRNAGATFLAPLFHELSAVVCTSGTPRSHIGIVSREFQVPCVTAAVFAAAEPASGSDIEVDCTGTDGIIRG